MSPRPYRIGRSRSGLGLFATAEIRKGAFVVAYRGRLIGNDEAERMMNRSARYLFEVNSRWTIDGSSRRNLARYVNHSCRPNVEIILRNRKVHYRARRRIRPGEEITVDYGSQYFDTFIGRSRCQCERCRERRNGRRRARASSAKKSRRPLHARRIRG